MDTLPPINHIFIDYENVHDVDLSIVGLKSVSINILLGPKQTKLGAALVEKLLQHAASVHLVRLTTTGKNALDFSLAYYVGRAAVLDPSGFFHIISGDKGFDPLVAHLRANHVRAHRHPDFTSLKILLNPVPPAVADAANLPAPAPAKTVKAAKPPKAPKTAEPVAPSLDERASRVLEHLRSHSTNRPGSEKALIRHLLNNRIAEEEVANVIETLRSAGHIAITLKGGVTYKF